MQTNFPLKTQQYSRPQPPRGVGRFWDERSGGSKAPERSELWLLERRLYFTNGQGQHSGIGSCACVRLEAAKKEIAIAAMNRIFFNMSCFSP